MTMAPAELAWHQHSAGTGALALSFICFAGLRSCYCDMLDAVGRMLGAPLLPVEGEDNCPHYAAATAVCCSGSAYWEDGSGGAWGHWQSSLLSNTEQSTRAVAGKDVPSAAPPGEPTHKQQGFDT